MKFVPYPSPDDDPEFISLLRGKAEMRPVASDENCDSVRNKFDLHPAQQFVATYMSAATPYKSLLVFHGVGVGKSCSGIQLATSVPAGDKKPIVVVPRTVKDGFRRAFLDIGRIPVRDDGTLDLRKGARRMCTGSSQLTRFIAEDDAGQRKTAEEMRESVLQRVGRKFILLGHEAFGNQIHNYIEAARTDFEGNEDVDREIDTRLRDAFDGRLIIIDEAHKIVPHDAAEGKDSYNLIMRLLSACTRIRLVLMTATPMYNRSNEIVKLLNLLLKNDGRELLKDRDVFAAGGNELTPRGMDAIRRAAKGRVSFASGEDPNVFPRSVSAAVAGVECNRPAAQPKPEDGDAADARAVWEDERIVYSRITARQRSVLATMAADASTSSSMLQRQVGNACFDDQGGAMGEQGFRRAFRFTDRGVAKTVAYREGFAGCLAPGALAKTAPKIHEVMRAVDRADGTVFVYSEYLYFGVLALAVALEEAGLSPVRGRPLLDNPSGGRPRRTGEYLIVTNDDAFNQGMSFGEKVAAVNAEGGGVRVVIGTRAASEGFDFHRVREIHVLEPWYNMSRLRQVFGRGIRRCSHALLPPELRNITLAIHCLVDGDEPDAESLDQRTLRIAFVKDRAIQQVTSALRAAAVDCGLYREMATAQPAPIITSRGRTYRPPPLRSAYAGQACEAPWPHVSTDESTDSPYFKNAVIDMTAMDVREALSSMDRPAAWADIRALIPEHVPDVVLALAVDALLDPVSGAGYLYPMKLLYRGGNYLLVSTEIRESVFTVAEARLGNVYEALSPRTVPFSP